MDAGTTMATTTTIWQSCWVQTFLAKNHGGYFVVEVDEDRITWARVRARARANEMIDQELEDEVEAILERAARLDLEDELKQGIINDNTQVVDRTPWLVRTG